jgi:hypothetical protein
MCVLSLRPIVALRCDVPLPRVWAFAGVWRRIADSIPPALEQERTPGATRTLV